MKTKLSWLDRIMAAVTFAEANEPDIGRELLCGNGCASEKKRKNRECETVLASDLHGANLHS